MPKVLFWPFVEIKAWIEPGHMDGGFKCQFTSQYFIFVMALICKAQAFIKCMDLMVMCPDIQFDPADMPVVLLYGIQKLPKQFAPNSPPLVVRMHHNGQVWQYVPECKNVWRISMYFAYNAWIFFFCKQHKAIFQRFFHETLYVVLCDLFFVSDDAITLYGNELVKCLQFLQVLLVGRNDLDTHDLPVFYQCKDNRMIFDIQALFAVEKTFSDFNQKCICFSVSLSWSISCHFIRQTKSSVLLKPLLFQNTSSGI